MSNQLSVGSKSDTVKPVQAVTSIKQSSVL